MSWKSTHRRENSPGRQVFCKEIMVRRVGKVVVLILIVVYYYFRVMLRSHCYLKIIFFSSLISVCFRCEDPMH